MHQANSWAPRFDTAEPGRLLMEEVTWFHVVHQAAHSPLGPQRPAASGAGAHPLASASATLWMIKVTDGTRDRDGRARGHGWCRESGARARDCSCAPPEDPRRRKLPHIPFPLRPSCPPLMWPRAPPASLDLIHQVKALRLWDGKHSDQIKGPWTGD